MALQDPSNPFALPIGAYSDAEFDAIYQQAFGGGVVDPQGDQQFGASLLSPSALLPTTVQVPQAPAPQLPPPNGPRGTMVGGVFVPEAYDDAESPPAGAQPPGWHPASPDGAQSFPWSPEKPAPQPRTDAARIGAFGQPIPGEELATGAWVSPDFGKPEIEADAISGGAIDGQIAEEIAKPKINEAWAPTAEMSDDYRSPTELGQSWSDKLTPEQQEQKRAEIEDEREKIRAAGSLSAGTQALKDAENNARDYQTAIKTAQERSEALDLEAQQLALEKIDPLGNISTGQKITGVLAAFLGGLTMHKTGRNIGLESIASMINDEIAVQTANISNRKDMLGRRQNAIGEQLAMGKDLHHAQETLRLATYDQLIKKVETDAQQYNPRGTRALKAMDTANQLKAARAQSLLKARDTEMKRIEAMLKEERERAKVLEDIRHNKATEGVAWKNAKNDEIRALADKTKADAEAGGNAHYDANGLRAQGIAIPEGVQLPAGGWSVKQAKLVADSAKSVEDWQKAARENSPEELNRELGVGELLDEDNKALRFRSPESANNVAVLKGAADFGVQLLDRLNTAYKVHGWSSDLLKSPEWQTAQADFNQYMLEKKNIDQLGVLAGPDLGLIKGTMGALDPTGVRDPGPGLTRARENVIEKLNSTVRAQVAPGVKPKRWEPPKPLPPAPKSPMQGTVQNLLTFDPKRPKKEETAELGGIDKVVDGAPPPPSYFAAIDRLVAVFNDPTADAKARDEAAAHLEALKNTAKSGAIREYAVKAAGAGAMESIPLSTD